MLSAHPRPARGPDARRDPLLHEQHALEHDLQQDRGEKRDEEALRDHRREELDEHAQHDQIDEDVDEIDGPHPHRASVSRSAGRDARLRP